MSLSPAAITDLVSEEVSKYQDLQMITEKLKSKGYYDRVLEVLLELFKEEAIFTHSELDKILTPKGEQAELMEQFWINSEVFRSNLVLIFTSMSSLLLSVVNSIWRSEDLVRQVLEERLTVEADEQDNGKMTFGRKPASKVDPIVERKDQVRKALEQGRKDFAKISSSFSDVKKYQHNTSLPGFGGSKPAKRPSTGQVGRSSKKERQLKGSHEHGVKIGTTSLKEEDHNLEERETDNHDELGPAHDHRGLHSGGKIYQSDVDLKVPEDAFFKRSNRPSKESLQDPGRNRSRSFDRTSFQSAARPRSGSRGSRNFAAEQSQYSSVHSRILNAGEVNKIRKLVGERNSDLDVD